MDYENAKPSAGSKTWPSESPGPRAASSSENGIDALFLEVSRLSQTIDQLSGMLAKLHYDVLGLPESGEKTSGSICANPVIGRIGEVRERFAAERRRLCSLQEGVTIILETLT